MFAQGVCVRTRQNRKLLALFLVFLPPLTAWFLSCTIKDDNGSLVPVGPGNDTPATINPDDTVPSGVVPAFIVVKGTAYVGIGDTMELTVTAVEASTLGDSPGERRLSGLRILVSTATGWLSHDTLTTDKNGRAQVKFRDTSPGRAEVTFRNGSVSQVVRFDITNTPDKVQRLIEALPERATIKADGTDNTIIRVTIIDTNHNPVVGETVQFITTAGVIAGANPPSAALSGRSTTDAAGVASARLTSANINDTAYVTVFLASDPTMNTETQVSFTGVAIQLESSALNIKVDDHITITAYLVNGSAKPVVNSPVYFALGRGNSSSLSIVSVDSVSGFDGRARMQLKGKSTGTDSVTVIAAGARSSISINVTNLVLKVTMSSYNLAANSDSRATLKADFTDEDGDPLKNKLIRVVRYFPRLDGTPGSDTLFDSTDTDGIVRFDIEPMLYDATVRLQVTGVNTATDVASAEAVVTYLTTRSIMISAVPTIIQADGTSQSTITVQVKNEQNNPMVGDTVRFSSSAGVVSAIAITNESGKAVAKLTSDRRNALANVVAVLSKDPGKNDTVQVEFVGVEASASANPRSIRADGKDTSLVSVTLADAASNPIAGENVTFEAGQRNTSLRAVGTDGKNLTATVTNNRGEAQCKVWGTGAGLDTILVSTGAQAQTFAIIAYSDNRLTIDTARGQTYVADSRDSTRLILRYTSGTGSPLNNVPIDISVSMGNLGTVFASVCTTNAAGVDTFWMRNPGFATAVTVSAEAHSNAEITVGAFGLYFRASALKSINITGTPEVINTNGDRARIIATAFDSLGNRVKDARISFNMINGPGAGEYLDPPTAVTRADGTVETFLVSGTGPSKYHEIAVVAGDFDGMKSDTLFFTIVGPPASITLRREINGLADNNDGSYTLPCVALVTDINGNPVADETEVTFSLKITGYQIYPRHATLKKVSSNPKRWEYQIDSTTYYPILLPFEDLNDNYRTDAGEDLNGDGTASRGEDINGNGKKEFSPAFVDINENGQRDCCTACTPETSAEPYYIYITTDDSGATVYDTTFADYNNNGLLDTIEPLVSNTITNNQWTAMNAAVPGGLGFDYDWNGNGQLDPITTAFVGRTVQTSQGRAQNFITYGQSDALRIRVRVTAECRGIITQSPQEFVLPLLKEDAPYWCPRCE